MEAERTTRRSFLSHLLAVTLLSGAAGLLSAVVAYLFPRAEVSSALGPRRVRVGKPDEILPGEGKLTLVDEEPVWVVRLTREFVAMSALCTHKDCIVKWDEEGRLFRCPCHEGQFDEHGNVVFGLPLRPLTRFRVGLLEGDLFVFRGDQREV